MRNTKSLIRLVVLTAAFAFLAALSFGEITGVVTTPGGTNGQVQYNNRNTFGASSDLTYSTATKTLSAPKVSVGTITFNDATQQTTAGLALSTFTASISSMSASYTAVSTFTAYRSSVSASMLAISTYTAFTSSVSASFTALSTFTAFASSVPVAYMAVSSLPAPGNVMSYSSAAVSYVGISTGATHLTISSAAVSYVGISSLTAANGVLTLSSASVAYLGISSASVLSPLAMTYSSASVSYLAISSAPVGVPSTSGSNTWTGTNIFNSSNSIKGTTLADNPQSGYYGEFISTVAGPGYAPFAGGSNAYSQLLALSIPAGDWDVSVQLVFLRNSATFTSTSFEVDLGQTSASGVGCTLGQNKLSFENSVSTTFNWWSFCIPMYRVSQASTVTWYLNSYLDTYTSGTPKWIGSIMARRRR